MDDKTLIQEEVDQSFSDGQSDSDEECVSKEKYGTLTLSHVAYLRVRQTFFIMSMSPYLSLLAHFSSLSLFSALKL